MSSFQFLKDIFGGKQATAQEQETLYQEVMMLVLSRASRADLDVADVEIEHIQKILSQTTGMDVSEKDIRVASASDIYENASLDSLVKSAAKQLDVTRRGQIANALFEVIASDGKVSATEADFFDSVVSQLNLRPVEIAGGVIDQ